MAKRVFRAATRGSVLARWQTDYIIQMLGVEVESVIVETTGDKNRDVPIESIRGQGVFVKEVQAAVLDGRADFAIHSAKDLPSETDEGLFLASIPERGDARDALIGKSLDELQAGAAVATGSVRRRAQLASLRPDLTFHPLRGNVDTRLEKAKQFDAIVSAYAPIQRLGRTDARAHVLDVSVLLPQVAQGALAVECRSDDEETASLFASIEHGASRRAVDAERAFLSALGGGCDLPVGAYAVIEDDAVVLRTLLASLDGRVVLRRTDSATNGIELGQRLANALLQEDGGAALLMDHRAPVA